MSRKSKTRKQPYTNPDHRPMIPALRRPDDPLDIAVREARRRYDEINPNERINWR